MSISGRLSACHAGGLLSKRLEFLSFNRKTAYKWFFVTRVRLKILPLTCDQFELAVSQDNDHTVKQLTTSRSLSCYWGKTPSVVIRKTYNGPTSSYRHTSLSNNSRKNSPLKVVKTQATNSFGVSAIHTSFVTYAASIYTVCKQSIQNMEEMKKEIQKEANN